MKYTADPFAVECARVAGMGWMTTEQPSYEALVAIINHVVDACAERAAHELSDNPEIVRGVIHSVKVRL